MLLHLTVVDMHVIYIIHVILQNPKQNETREAIFQANDSIYDQLGYKPSTHYHKAHICKYTAFISFSCPAVYPLQKNIYHHVP